VCKRDVLSDIRPDGMVLGDNNVIASLDTVFGQPRCIEVDGVTVLRWISTIIRRYALTVMDEIMKNVHRKVS